MSQRYRTIFNFFLFSLLLVTSVAFGQTGNWAPANADLSYPITLLKASELQTVRNNLTNPELYSLYQSVYADAFAAPSGATGTTEYRRSSARIAKNAAFVLLIDLKPVTGTTQNLTQIERDDLSAKVVLLLESLNPAVEPFLQGTTPKYEDWQWRTKELIDYLIAYDLLLGSGNSSSALGRQNLQTFAGNLYYESTREHFYFGFSLGSFYTNIKNNHALMTTAALGMAAVVLNDVTSASAQNQPLNWINAAMYHTDNVLWKDAKRQSEPGKIAGYAEGPYYFKYAFYNLLPFFRAMGNFLPNQPNLPADYTWNTTTVTLQNPYYDTNYDNLYKWATTIMLPDGRLPALEDSYIDMGMPELMLTGKPQYVKPMDFSKFSSGQLASLDGQLNTTVDMRAAYIAAYQTPNPETQLGLTALPESGNLIFRSGNSASDNYLHVYGKNGNSLLNSGGHNHGDAGSFQLYGKGQLLAFDPGYISYSQRSQVGNANNHNLVLVDGAGPVIGAPSVPNDAQAYIQNTFSSGDLSYGEVQTTYQNATINRKTISIRNEYYLIADFITAAATHNYTWQLHGFGLETGTATVEGTFTDDLANGKGYWTKNGVTLLAHVTANNGVSGFAKPTAVHELTAGTTQNHTAMQATKNGEANTQFLAFLQPYTTAPATVQNLTQTGIAGLTVNQNAVTDLIFTQTTSAATTVTSSLSQTVSSNALLTTYSEDATDFKSLFIQNGEYLDYGTLRLVQSDVLADISLEKTGTETFAGYVNKAATVVFAVTGTPTTISGATISNSQYDAVAKTLSLTFTGPGNFSYKDQVNPLPVELIEFKGKRKNETTSELTWSTASETENAGFEILKKTAENDVFEKVGFVKGNGNSTIINTYSFLDRNATEAAYYQLRQLDVDGTATLSKIVFVTGAKNSEASLQVWPIPAQDELTIQPTGLSENGTFNLILSNASGQVMHQQKFKSTLKLDISHFKPGLYFLQVIDPETNQKLTQKVIIGR